MMRRARLALGGQADHLLVNAAGKIFINCATISPAVHIEVEKGARSGRIAGSLHGLEHHPSPARHALLNGGDEAVFKKVEPILRT